jgi:hypothetical protein
MKACLPLMMSLLAGALSAGSSEPDGRFISNDRLRIGIDAGSGGAVFWLSSLPDGPNLLNHYDRGRLIQQSYYGKPDGSKWGDKDWRWNPVQGGHYQGKPAKVLDQRIDGNSIYVKSVPMHWAVQELLEDCLMEQWIRLDGDLVVIRYRFTYQGKEAHPAHHQEMPAVFVDAKMENLVSYQGEKSWTGEPLTSEKPGWPNAYRDCPEEWAGYFGSDGRGVAVHFPGTKRITCYRFAGPAGPAGAGCSYFAPIRTIAIGPGFKLDYMIHLTIGTAAEARQRFSATRSAKPSTTNP